MPTPRAHRLWLLLDLVLPSHCFCCGARLEAVQRHGACPRCWFDLAPTRADVGPGLSGCCAVAYSETARRFLLRAKFGRRRELFGPMSGMLLASIRHAGYAPSCVVPVPSHPWSRIVRGFSPALELAGPLARRLGIPVRNALGRSWAGSRSIKRLSREERIRTAARVFSLRGSLAGESVLLVDDLATSGATLLRCASLCERSGAASVRSAVWARSMEFNYKN